jgi:hypothetical protein
LALTKVTEDIRTLGTGEVAIGNISGSAAGAVGSFLKQDGTWAAVPATDTTTIEDDIALLGFKVAANGSLAKYNLDDQTVDAFEDATGIDASASTGETFNAVSNYYSGITNIPTGGTITTYTGYTVHSFLADGTFTTGTSGNVDYVVVAGGASGGAQIGGGGGAGGHRSDTGMALTAAAYSVVVGDGGVYPSASSQGNDGDDSSFNSIISTGGGGGAHHNAGGPLAGSVGGSGGGGSTTNGLGGAGNTPSTSPSQGNAGGGAGAHTSPYNAGGGGGAGAVGTTGSPSQSGNGGNGVANSITGVSVTRAGGGGGNSYSGTGGPGGTGGGGNGASGASDSGDNGTANTGGGGGGRETTSGSSGSGGSGIVIISYANGQFISGTDMVLQSNATTANSAPTKGDIVMTYTNGLGTATLNTDLTAEFSADNGVTWTLTTLVAQGSTGTHFIVSAHDITRTSTSGTTMKYRIKTLNQGVAKETRIQAVSLGWS